MRQATGNPKLVVERTQDSFAMKAFELCTLRDDLIYFRLRCIADRLAIEGAESVKPRSGSLGSNIVRAIEIFWRNFQSTNGQVTLYS